MIVGNGDIATILKEKCSTPDDFLFFASGVSNSRCTDRDEYNREINLLKQHALTTMHIVYFSTYAVFYSNSEYAAHKWYVENYIKSKFANYTIARLGNIAWGNNPNTLINYLKSKIIKKEKYYVRNECRILTFPRDFVCAIKQITSQKLNEFNIKGVRLSIKEIVRLIKAGQL